MRPLFPIARTMKEALEAPLGHARNAIEAERLDRAGARVEFAVGLAPDGFATREAVEAAFAGPIAEGWAQPEFDVNRRWRVWISWWRPIRTEPAASLLSAEERRAIDLGVAAPMRPRRAVEQKPLDFGLFEADDPDRPGWSVADE